MTMPTISQLISININNQKVNNSNYIKSNLNNINNDI